LGESPWRFESSRPHSPERGMPGGRRKQRIEGAVTVLAPPEPVSPELVLVSPPEVARLMRSLLPDPSRAAPVPPVRLAEPRQILQLAGVWLFCLLVTLGPLVLAILATRAP
jgi:hypothetical protein